MNTEKYDTIGTNYNQTRKADKYLTERLVHYLQPQNGNTYLDIGCGTGNYTLAISLNGGSFIGVEPSAKMLNKAKEKSDKIKWLQGNTENIPLADNSIEGIMATLTLHHWDDIHKGLKELKRVLKPHGKVVIFTSTPEQMKGYWLNHYFPKMLHDSITQMPSYEWIEEGLIKAGFKNINTEIYVVKEDLQDLFLYAGKNRPELYLREDVRHGISSFSHLSNKLEVEKGLAELEKDMNNGKLADVIRQYENDKGDYLFITATAEKS